MEWLPTVRLAIAAFLIIAPASTISAPRDPLAEALALPVASNLVGARQAERFAWVENKAGVRNIWTAVPGQPARQLTGFTQDDGTQVYDLALSPDGARLLFVRGGDGEFPDDAIPNPALSTEAPRQQVFAIDTAGGQPRALGDGHSPIFSTTGAKVAFTRRGEIWVADAGAEPRKIATVRGEVRRLQWSPDEQRLLFMEDRGSHAYVALLPVAGDTVTYLDPNLGYSVEPTFSPDGAQVAFIRYIDPPPGAAADGGPYWSIRVADVATGRGRQLWAAPKGAGARYGGTRSRNLFWSADGKLVFPWERSGWLNFYTLDARRGGEPRALTPGAFEVETLLLSPDGRSATYAANAGDIDRRHIWRVPISGGAPVRVTGGDGIENYPTFAARQLAVIASDYRHPAHPVLAGRNLQPLGTRVAAAGFRPPEQVVFKAEDGTVVHGQLFRASGSGKRPALVYVHGGPRRQMLLGFIPSGYYSNAYILNQQLAASGYNVLSVNYRSGTGYGQAFRDAPGTARDGAAEYRDIAAAGRWLAARDDVDPDRIGIWGGSWGGYLTALALARDSDLFAAGVDFHGVHSLLRAVPNSLSPSQQETARGLQWGASPIEQMDRWRSPVLLIHGDDDLNVDFSQSLLIARELAARGIPYEELVYPNERHTFMRYDHWLESLRATRDFLDKHLKSAR